MLKDTKKKPSAKQPSENGHLESILNTLTEQLGQNAKTMKDLQDQVDDLREKKDSDGGARRLIADNLYNTPYDRRREYSNISNAAVEPFSLAMTCAAVLDPDVLSGKKSLCEIFLENILTFRRAVGGQLARFAAEQAKEEAQKTNESLGEEAKLGQGM